MPLARAEYGAHRDPIREERGPGPWVDERLGQLETPLLATQDRGNVMLLERLVQRSYRPVNRKDLEAVMSTWAPDAVFEFPGRSSISGRFVGKPAIEAWWRRWFDRMRSVRFTVDRVAFANPFALTFANTMFVEWHTDVVTHDGLRAHAAGVSVVRLRRGKIVHARDYFFDPTIEEQVWGPAQDGIAD